MKSTVNPGRFPEFKVRLNILARKYNSSPTEFAKALGISRQTVGFWLNGDRVPDAESLITIAEKTGVSVDWLLGITNVNNPSSDDMTKIVSDYLGLSSRAVDSIHAFSDGDAGESGIMDYLICNASELNPNSFLYYIWRAQKIIPRGAKEKWEDAKRKALPNRDGIEMNRREAIDYFIEKAKTNFGRTVEAYIKARWNNEQIQLPKEDTWLYGSLEGGDK